MYNNKDNSEFEIHSNSRSNRNKQEKESNYNPKSIDDDIYKQDSARDNRNLTSESYLNNKKSKNKKSKKYYFSIKYTVLLITLWLIFTASFIVGFIVHFDVKSAVNASSIIWSFSGIILVVSILYSIVYYKARKARTNEELGRLLKFIPL